MLCTCDNCTDSDILFNNLHQFGKDLRYNNQLGKLVDFFFASEYEV